MVRYALLSSDAVAYAEQILLARGGRTSTEVKEFFESVADLYIDELLTLKHMEKAKDVLRNTVSVASSWTVIYYYLKAVKL